MAYRKKLIEVSLPLEDINKASAREKSIRHGHPSTLHLWWARRPLAACRAVLFAQLVDDPSAWPDRFPTEAAQAAERERLHDLIRRLVPWEASNDEAILNEARWHIARSVAWGRDEEPPARDRPEAVLRYLRDHAPPVYDPFCGGGSIPLEAQRLGLRAIASDLNPVAVMITKALIEFPPRFAGLPPANPEARRQLQVGGWKGARGLAEDVRYYGSWMRDEGERRIGHLYPKARLPDGSEATVIAWLWARTVRSPNPAAKGAMVPLVSSFMLSMKEGQQAWVEPVLDTAAPDGYRFEVRTGSLAKAQVEKTGEGTISRKGGRCILTGAPMPFTHVRAEGQAGRMGERLMAIVAEGERRRVYLAPDTSHERIAREANPSWKPDHQLPNNPRDFKTPNYGMRTFGDLFTRRQLAALTTFSDLISECRARAEGDATAAGLEPSPIRLAAGGCGASAYADAIALYLAFAFSKFADMGSAQCFWHNGAQHQKIVNTFGRQALPMVWDYAEGNAFSSSSGNFFRQVELIRNSINFVQPVSASFAFQKDACEPSDLRKVCVTTDPPYYDNIGYAELSDFFYVWLSKSLKEIFPELLATLLVPKAQELVATPYRHGSKEAAEEFFVAGMTRALTSMWATAFEDVPAAVFYAFRQSEVEHEGVASTGWSTFLQAVLGAGFEVGGTWPVRTELVGNLKRKVNALASSIVLVCRRRPELAPVITRAEFLRTLKRELPIAIRTLQAGAIAPVDLAQAAIGPGMAVFSRCKAVLESDDSPMPVKTALALINQELDAILASEDADYDGWTRFAVAWFEQQGHEAGEFGVANVLANAKAVGVNGVVQAGIAEARAGKVRLLRRDELPEDWNPAEDDRLTVWEAVQHLTRRHEAGGVEGAAELLARLPGPIADAARELAYRLYQVCERRKWAQEALPYNALVADWPEIQKRAVGYATPAAPGLAQGRLAV